VQDARLPVAAAVVQLCDEGYMGSAYNGLEVASERVCELINNARYPRYCYCGVHGKQGWHLKRCLRAIIWFYIVIKYSCETYQPAAWTRNIVSPGWIW
jgi:hypothetical protein